MQVFGTGAVQICSINTNLQTEQNKDFILRVKTIGVVPENVMIFIEDESYF
jgi:hypothetical protein